MISISVPKFIAHYHLLKVRAIVFFVVPRFVFSSKYYIVSVALCIVYVTPLYMCLYNTCNHALFIL
jgi:hypothetical protein